jgi:ABC-type transport system substrate-binding protein
MAVLFSRITFVMVSLALAAGCAASGPTGQSVGSAGSGTALRKAITISIEGEINALATELDASGVSGLSAYVHDFFHDYITVHGDDDEVLPQLTTQLPSQEDGTWKILLDGRMEVTWKLRPGVKWHDGTEFTSADVKFGWEVSADPVAPLGTASEVARRIEGMDTPDPYTVVAHWKETSRWARELGRTQTNLLPRHLLEADFRANKEGLNTHPYFTRVDAVIGTGPYRATEWARGSHLLVEANDQYWQGRPKIDRVTFKFIKDNQTVLANLLAGDTDVANRGISWDGVQFLQRDWLPQGRGELQIQPTNFRHNLFQFRPEVASPGDLLNVNVRRSLLHALDRELLVEGVYPGAGAQAVAHSIGYPGTPIGDTLERSITKYPHDPTRAAQLLENAGWRKGTDGMLAKGSERFRLELQVGGDSEDDKTFTVMESMYRPLGIELVYLSFGGRRQTPEDTARFSGLQKTGLPFNQPTFGRRWDGRDVAAPENRYSGGNRSAYRNPSVDQALDSIERSVSFADELRWWGEAWKHISEDVGVMGLFFVPNPIATKKGVVGPLPRNASGQATWRAHTWDVQ